MPTGFERVQRKAGQALGRWVARTRPWIGLAGTRLPDFLGIGAQKAGTKWLYANLARHPAIYLPTPKELHHFDDRFDTPLSRYRAHFAPAGRRKTGEITPSYGLLADDRIAFIKQHMPDLRIILILRHPVDRAWSHALMDLLSGRGRRYESLTEAQILRHLGSEGSRARGDYDRILERWLRHYPIEQLLLLSFDDIAARPREVLSRTFAHVGVPIPDDWSRFPAETVVHGGAGVAIPDAYAAVLREQYREPLERLARRLESLGLPPQFAD